MSAVQKQTAVLSGPPTLLQKRYHCFNLLRVALCALALFALAATDAPAQILDRPQTPPPRRVSGKRTPPGAKPQRGPQESVILRGDELHGRPDADWAIKLNLAGFKDETSLARRPWIVRFAVRDDSVGLTLAHVHQRQLRPEDSLLTIEEFVNSIYENIGKDSAVDITSMKQRKIHGLETIEYTKRELWPDVDPDDSTKSINKIIRRRHFNAYKLYKGMYVDVHLSKTEYLPKDSTIFTDIIKTFEIVDPAPPFDPRTGKRVSNTIGK